MSLIVSIETATAICSVAVHKGGVLIGSTTLCRDKSHSEVLSPLIFQLLENCKLEMSDLDAVAVSSGPGSYTGLRIGVSTAKGLCYGLDIPLVSVNTLEAMALKIANSNNNQYWLCPMLDARRMEVYTILYDNNLQVIEDTNAKVIDETSFDHYLTNNKIIFFGNGSDKCKNVISHNNALFIDNVIPDAEHIGIIASRKLQNNILEDLAYFEPFYLKEFMVTKPKSSR